MADRLNDRPVFTIVMGCNGAGKSAWKRENRDRLPARYFDADSIARGIGPRARPYIDHRIEKIISAGLDFGIESNYAGDSGPAMVTRLKRAGYRVEGVYIGTDSTDINAERIEHRVAASTGHRVDTARLPGRYRRSLWNLSGTAHLFDALEITDNSAHDAGRRPSPDRQLRLADGVAGWRADPLRGWCLDWLDRYERSRADRERRSVPAQGGDRGTDGGGPQGRG